MIGQIAHQFKGINKDLGKQVYGKDFYWDARNMRISISKDSHGTGTLVNEKGNSLYFTLPTVSISSGIV